MSDKPGIPSWQRAQAPAAPSPPTPSPDEQAAAPEKRPAETPGASIQEATRDDWQSESASPTLLERASRFLQDPTIRDEPREKKVAFLQSKGVAAEDIEALLSGQSEGENRLDSTRDGERVRTEMPTSSAPSTSSSTSSSTPPATSSPSPPITSSTSPSTSPSTSTPAPNPPAREIPPIVTYPEFLTPATKAPPLITTRRLVNTAYVAGGLAATMYGVAKFIIAPMTQSLAESRHDFAAHTKEKLDSFNTRLGEMVSEDPAHKPKISDVVDDISEADSDPTELFHRDFGTQTTPSLSRRPSMSTPSDETSMVAAHEKRLKIITSHIRELEATRSNDYASSESLKTKIFDLSTYLNELSYQNQYYSPMNGFYSNNYGVSKSGKDDQIETLKSDIRAVKGVFLSARNFYPGGSPRMSGQVS